MDNLRTKAENKKKGKAILIADAIAVTIVVALVWIFVFSPFSTDNNKSQWNKPKMVSTIFTEADDFVAHIEDTVGFDFPDDYTTIRDTTHLSTFSHRGNKYEGTIDYFCCVFLHNTPQEEIEKLEKEIAGDERFVKTLGDLKILTDSVGGDNLYEYKMVYVMDNGEYNTMPDTAGEYRIITVYYDTDDHSFTIEEFNNKYWKMENRTQ